MSRKIIYYLILTALIINIANSATVRGIVKGKKVGSLTNAVVYVERIKDKKFVPPKTNVVLETKSHSFSPHILPILAGTTVEIPYYDNIKSCEYTHISFDKPEKGIKSESAKKALTFSNPGVLPLYCKIHNEMSAFIIVCETPYFCVSDDKGNYKIQNIPEGKYKISVWQEDEFLKNKNLKTYKSIYISSKEDKIVNFTFSD